MARLTGCFAQLKHLVVVAGQWQERWGPERTDVHRQSTLAQRAQQEHKKLMGDHVYH